VSYTPKNDRLPRKPNTLNERLLKPASYQTIEKSDDAQAKRPESGRFVSIEPPGGKEAAHRQPTK
jgi:hypothetical protein